jgi:hypothetical protein
LLSKAPEKARERATALLADAPELSEARVLRGRASLRLGDTATALADLLPLLADDAGALTEPAALLDGGRAALAQKDLEHAARFYRALGSRAALLESRGEQAIAYIEIAATLLATETAPVDDVLAYLREARRRSSGSGFSGLCTALTAVAWTAQGREAEGQGALGEVGDVEALSRFEARGPVWLPDGMFHAVMGLVLEQSNPEQSAGHYQALGQSSLAATRVGKLGTRPRGRAGAGKGSKRGNR